MHSGKAGSNLISLGGKRRNKRISRRPSNMKSRTSAPIIVKRLRCYASGLTKLNPESVKVTE